jgi:RNA polymerase sigma factor (sigma-70 family)
LHFPQKKFQEKIFLLKCNPSHLITTYLFEHHVLVRYMNKPNLDACLRGDRKEQKKFFECFKGKMFALCLRYANSREDAEDMLQEGFVKVFRDLPQYTGVGNFEGWVRKIFVNTALQHLQKQRKEMFTVALDGHEFAADPEPFQSDEAPAKNMIAILQKLPPGFRSVFNLHVLEGYSHPEIAEILHISVGTSKSQLLRAKAHFRALLEGSLTA